MARKSRKVDYVNVGNKENLVTEAENQCEKVSHAALYARLSYESEKNRERNTIETQMVKDKLYDLNLEKHWYQYRDEAYEKIARQAPASHIGLFVFSSKSRLYLPWIL